MEKINFFLDIKKKVVGNIPYVLAYYGASTTSVEFVFPNWGEIIRYVLKDFCETETGDYEKAYWNIQTMNLGLNGAGSGDLLKRLDSLVLSRNPDLVILDDGKNDYYYGIDKKTSYENSARIIDPILAKGAKIIYTTSFPALWPELNAKLNDYIENDRKIAAKYAADNRLLFIDFYKAVTREEIEKSYTLVSQGGNEDVGYKPGEVDPIHYNKYGNALVAKIILKEAFGIDFDADKFLVSISDNTKKYPEY